MLVTGTGPGAYEVQKNGYYTQANFLVLFQPVSFLEGYLKLTATARPGSFYVPLSLENYSRQDLGLTVDTVYGKVDIFAALGLSLPVNLFLKTGKYKSEAANYQSFSKFGLETILDVLETANTYNFDIAVETQPLGDETLLFAAFTGNYRFDEAVQRLYDNDGGVAKHGDVVLGKFAPQFLVFLGLNNFELAGGSLNAEIMYGQNVSDIYSGHAFGFDAGYALPLSGTVSIPIGLGFGWYEKNIDVLSRTANTASKTETFDFRNTLSGALTAGIRFTGGAFDVNANLAGVFSRIEHIYRDPLPVISVSLDVECNYLNNYFIGAGFVAGTLTDVQWKTKADINPALDGNGFDHTFTLADNFGYEIYAGINVWKNSRFIIGFNQNKGIAMNYNLENKAEGQMKYKLAGSEAVDNLYESGGLYLKFTFAW
ncbi:MAG: hypothetical protein LBD48_13790 [Treponema sp.]|nr:hypothetical protein [Treponema sp.]